MSVVVRTYKRGGWEVDFQVIYDNGTEGPRVRRRSPRPSRSASVRWAEGLRKKLEAEGPNHRVNKELPTLDGLLDIYLQRSAKIGGSRGPSGATWIERQRSAYDNWVRTRFGRRKVSAIDARSLDSLVAAMVDAGRKPRTIRNTLDTVRGILKMAKRYGHIREVPEFPRIHMNQPDRYAHSYEDVQRLMSVADEWNDPASVPVLTLGLFASLRAGEILGLQWSDVDLDRGVLYVRRSITCRGEVKSPKSKAGERTVPLAGKLLNALQDWRRKAPVGVPWVFQVAGQPITHKWLTVRVVPVLKQAGLSERAPLQALRRTFCTQARLREIPEIQVKRWMGHAPSADVTDMHYTGDFPVDVQLEWIHRLEQPPRTRSSHAFWRHTGDALEAQS